MKKYGLLVFTILCIGFLISYAHSQEQPPVDDGYIPVPSGRTCPFCDSPFVYLIAKEKLTHVTSEYQDFRSTYNGILLKKNSVTVYVYVCEDGHVFYSLKFLIPKVCLSGALCFDKVD
jgi:hypothetical protein